MSENNAHEMAISSAALNNSPTAIIEDTQSKRVDDDGHDITHIERVLSSDTDHAADDNLKDHMDVSRVDKEVQHYASLGRVEIDEATNRRLLRKIDRRVLTFMIITYFLQAIDKGTLAFTSIMDLPKDTGLVGQQV